MISEPSNFVIQGQSGTKVASINIKINSDVCKGVANIHPYILTDGKRILLTERSEDLF